MIKSINDVNIIRNYIFTDAVARLDDNPNMTKKENVILTDQVLLAIEKLDKIGNELIEKE